MKKGVKILRVILIITIIFVIGEIISIIFSDTTVPHSPISGYSIKNTLIELYSKIPPISRILILVYFLILFLFFIFILLKSRKEKLQANHIQLVSDFREDKTLKTDLDVLYETLKKNKSLSITTIAQLFKISEEKAINWAKILEEKNLITIEYPLFGKPIVKVVGAEKEEKEKKGEEEREIEKKESKEETEEKEAEKKFQSLPLTFSSEMQKEKQETKLEEQSLSFSSSTSQPLQLKDLEFQDLNSTDNFKPGNLSPTLDEISEIKKELKIHEKSMDKDNKENKKAKNKKSKIKGEKEENERENNKKRWRE